MVPVTLQFIVQLVQSHKFWNNNNHIVYVTEKYMEFDLNDKGEIGRTPLAV